MNECTNATVDYNIHSDYEKHIEFVNLPTTTHVIPPISTNLQLLLESFLMAHPEYRLSKAINYYGYITEVVVGSVANILVLIIMLGLKHLPICNYMAALALADLFVLLGSCLLRWLAIDNYDLQSANTAMCRIVNFQSYCSFSLSAWLLVAMTIDRYIAITHPLKAIRISTPFRARAVIAMLMLAMVIINFHFLVTLVVEEKLGQKMRVCVSYDNYRYFIATVWPWIDATIYSFLPFTFLIIFNFLIIRSHRISAIVHSALKGSTPGEISVAASQVSRKITITLLTVTFAFIILTAPRVILMIIRPTVFNFVQTSTKLNYKILAQYTLTASLVNVLMYANHGVNFFLYVLTGHKFRQQLLNIFKYQGKRCKQPAKVATNSNENKILNLRCKIPTTKEDTDSIEDELQYDKTIHSFTLNPQTVYEQQSNNTDFSVSTDEEGTQNQHMCATNTCSVWSVSGSSFISSE